MPGIASLFVDVSRPAALPVRPRLSRRRRQRRLLVPLLALVIVVIAVIAGASDGDDPKLPPNALFLDVGGRPYGQRVPPGFVGLSLETNVLPVFAGGNPAAPNPTFLNLVRNLAPGQSPVIRFGGDTTDWTWITTAGFAKPGGIHYTIGPSWLRMAHAVAARINARMIPGINFEANSRIIAGHEARTILDAVGRRYIAGFELGNEPELYGTFGWYRTPGPGGVPVPGRSIDYNFRSFVPNFAYISASLPRGVPLVGPASGNPTWLAGTGQFLAANPRVKVTTFHRYPLHRCFAPDQLSTPSIPHLLTKAASAGIASTVASAVAAAHARGAALRVDEFNSVSCSGKRGVSDTFAAALWAIDALFQMDRVGVDGVNIHTTATAAYRPFTFRHLHGRWYARVEPLYYGLLTFAQAVPAYSRLLPTTVTPPAPGPAKPAAGGRRVGISVPPTIRTWADRGPDGTVHVVIINDSRSFPVTFAVRPPSQISSVTLSELRAAAINAKLRIYSAGRSFGAWNATGELPGSPRLATLSPVQGRYVVRMPPASVDVLTFRR